MQRPGGEKEKWWRTIGSWAVTEERDDVRAEVGGGGDIMKRCCSSAEEFRICFWDKRLKKGFNPGVGQRCSQIGVLEKSF